VKLSIITTGRNDNYGGDFRSRLLTAALRTQYETKRHGIDIEQIFVEWNPPAGKPYLSTELAQMGYTCYVVSPEVHKKRTDPNAGMVMMQFFAHNVGIRRATGDWMLATNPDDIHGLDVWDYLAHNELDPQVLYRARRFDVLLKWWGKSFKLMNAHRGLDHGTGPTSAAGDFLLFNAEYRKGFDEAINFSDIHGDGRFVRDWVRKRGGNGFDSRFWKCVGTVFKCDHPKIYRRTHGQRNHHRGLEGWNSKEKTCKRKGLYRNPESWGLWNEPQELIAERIWHIGINRD
jgi:hypothetical protein